MSESPTPPDFLAVITLFGGGAIGTIITALVNGFRKPSSQAEIIKAAQDAAGAVIGHLTDEIDRLTASVEIQEKHRETCERDLAATRLEMQTLRRRMNDLFPDHT